MKGEIFLKMKYRQGKSNETMNKRNGDMDQYFCLPRHEVIRLLVLHTLYLYKKWPSVLAPTNELVTPCTRQEYLVAYIDHASWWALERVQKNLVTYLLCKPWRPRYLHKESIPKKLRVHKLRIQLQSQILTTNLCKNFWSHSRKLFKIFYGTGPEREFFNKMTTK